MPVSNSVTAIIYIEEEPCFVFGMRYAFAGRLFCMLYDSHAPHLYNKTRPWCKSWKRRRGLELDLTLEDNSEENSAENFEANSEVEMSRDVFGREFS